MAGILAATLPAFEFLLELGVNGLPLGADLSKLSLEEWKALAAKTDALMTVTPYEAGLFKTDSVGKDGAPYSTIYLDTTPGEPGALAYGILKAS